MSKKTKAVFISSTFEDLKNYRRKIWELLENYDVNVRGMEKFGARKDAPLDTCLREVEQCDVFLCIIAHRIGSIDDASGKSFTQKEYEKARELDKDILIYVIDEKYAKILYGNMDFGEGRDKLIAFKSILKERHTTDTFISEDDLMEKVKRRFDELLAQKEETEPAGGDKYTQSKELIERFLLLPRIYSGREVKLEVNFVKQPFPASKFLCSSFNLSYGETIGVAIEINKPELGEYAIPYVFIEEDNLTKYFDLKKQDKIEVYGSLQFSENKIDAIRANFVRKEVYVGGFTATIMDSLALQNIIGEKKIIEADGTIIIKLTKILS